MLSCQFTDFLLPSGLGDVRFPGISSTFRLLPGPLPSLKVAILPCFFKRRFFSQRTPKSPFLWSRKHRSFLRSLLLRTLLAVRPTLSPGLPPPLLSNEIPLCLAAPDSSPPFPGRSFPLRRPKVALLPDLLALSEAPLFLMRGFLLNATENAPFLPFIC